MRWATRALLVLVVAGWLPAAAAAATDRPTADTPAPDTPVSVVLDRTDAQVGPGQKIRFESEVRNAGGQPLTGLVVHLAILSSEPDMYVDPEDWSPRRTQYVDRLEPGHTATLGWKVQAVTAGPLILYVTVTDPRSNTIAVSRPFYVTVSGRREVNAQNVLPLVTGVPAGVLVLLSLTGVRRRLRR